MKNQPDGKKVHVPTLSHEERARVETALYDAAGLAHDPREREIWMNLAEKWASMAERCGCGCQWCCR